VIGDLQSADPAKVGPYRLLGRLGAGGMGRVYVARSPGGRIVAIKVIRAELAEDQGFRDRFAREVAAARHVSGIFTAAVIDADPDGAMPWMATAYVPGPSLADAVQEHGPLHAESVRALAAGLAEGLQAIHQAGLVHRDLKPSNVLLAADGPRVIDFGISRALEGSRLTETGMLVGSPGFMSPEQTRGLTVGAASDVFNLGAVLTFAATGEGPFGSGPTLGLMFRVVHEPPDLTQVPDELRPLLEACLAKEPADRPSPGQLLDLLSEGVDVLTPDWLPPAVTATFSQYVPLSQGPVSGPQGMSGQETTPPPRAGHSTPGVPTASEAPRTQASQAPAPARPEPTVVSGGPTRADSTQASAWARPTDASATAPWAAGSAGTRTGAASALQGPAGPARRGRLRKRWLLVVAASVASLAIVAGVATAMISSSGQPHPVSPGQPTSSPSLDATATATTSPSPTATTAAPTRVPSSTSPTTSSWSPTPTATWTPTPTSTATDTSTPTATPSSSGGGCPSGCSPTPNAGTGHP
jgi:eukaryotic-like serine/threonine-protein kinase